MHIIFGYGLLKSINMETLIFILCAFTALFVLACCVAIPTIKFQEKLNEKLKQQFESKFE